MEPFKVAQTLGALRKARHNVRGGTLGAVCLGLALLLGTSMARSQPAPKFRVLYTFTNGADGANPLDGLLLSGSTLFGTAYAGGTNGTGTVFALNTAGTDFNVLHDFAPNVALYYDDEPWNPTGGYTNSEGGGPIGGLLVSGSTLFGSASGQQVAGGGTVFAVNTDGSHFRIFYNFATNGWAGDQPRSSLVLWSNTLLGTTSFGGSLGGGVVFAVNTDGTGFSDVLDFPGGANGWCPQSALVLSGITLYGTTYEGGTNAYYGTVFAMNKDGSNVICLHAFSGADGGADGEAPWAGVALSGNTLYGTAGHGGTNANGTVFALNTDGTSFKVLHTFTGGGDGGYPTASVIVSGSQLYGTAADGGAYGAGTVFAMNTDGTDFKVLYTFTNGADGAEPWGSLVQSGNTLYGTTSDGGTVGAGTIFAITLPSGPVIEPNSLAVVAGQLQCVVTELTPGATVYVQASSSLSSPGNWFPIATNVATSTNLTITGLTVTTAASRFFRVVEAYPP